MTPSAHLRWRDIVDCVAARIWPADQGIVIERPRWDLTIFKVHFGLLTLKACSKGEHVLRFEAVVHNTRQLGIGRVIERFPKAKSIVSRARASGRSPDMG